MRAFPHRFAPLALLLVTGLFANGSSASSQEAVRVRPIEPAPPVVTTYPSTHVDISPIIPLTPPVTLPVPSGNTPCCGPTTAGPEGSSGGGGSEAETVASPADNDRLAESAVDTMINELPIAAKQRSAE